MKKHGKIIVVFVVLIAFLIATAAQVSGAPSEKTRVWVEYAPGKAAAVNGYLRQVGAQYHYHFSDLDSFVVTVSSSAMQGLVNNPNVTYVEVDPERSLLEPQRVSLQDIPDENNPGQTIPYGIDMVQARDIWDADRDGVIDEGAPSGEGQTVCIIDTGYYEHEDLEAVPPVSGMSQIPGEVFSEDGYGHGTHVAGTISALNNNLGVVGVTPGTVSFFIVKIFDNAGEWVPNQHASDLTAAIYECAENEANVISMSLGGSSKSKKEREAFDHLYNAGILHVAAAGNDENDKYSYPASYDSVISVAAIDADKVKADFSQWNDQVELSAPGVNVLSTVSYVPNSFLFVADQAYPGLPMEFSPYGTATGTLVDGDRCLTTGDWEGFVVLCERGDASFYDKVMNVQNSGGIAAVIYNNEPGLFSGTLGKKGDYIVAISISREDGLTALAYLGQEATVQSSESIPGSSYESWNGTSMATPHVSGVAALIWSANTDWTNQQIRSAMKETAEDLGDVGLDNEYGYGLVQAAEALGYLEDMVVNDTLELDLKIGKRVFQAGDIVSIEVTVENGDSPIENASVQSIISTANGNQISSLLTTDQDGKATITYKVVLGRDGEGRYNVAVTTSAVGYVDANAETFFRVTK
jgi:subtilisin family serine protease